MSLSSYFSRLATKYSKSSEEEKAVAAILFTDVDISLGDKRLNSLAALTYNARTCENIFAMIEQALNPQDNPWKTIYKALLLLHTIVLFGSELSIDKAVGLCRFLTPLQTYNSALIKKGYFISTSGGMDYGAPVRAAAKTVDDILITDGNIRHARQQAREGQNTLVPMGDVFEQHNPSAGMGPVTYGQGLDTSVGAGFGLQAVPGMYEGRPERYFDRADDIRRPKEIRDSQVTRDAQAPSLLDLAFDDAPGNSGSNLPDAQYIPGLEKQRELEQQLAAQTEQLRRLQELQAQQQALQQAQQLQQQQNQAQFFQQPQAQFGVQSQPQYQPYPQQQQQYGQYGGAFPATQTATSSAVTGSLLDFGDSAVAPQSSNNTAMGMWGAGSSQPQQQQPYGGGLAYQPPQQQQPPHPGYGMGIPQQLNQQQQFNQFSSAPSHQQQQLLQQQQQPRSQSADPFGSLGMMMAPTPSIPSAAGPSMGGGYSGMPPQHQQQQQQQQQHYPPMHQQQQQLYQQPPQYYGSAATPTPPIPSATAPSGPPPPVPSFAPPAVPGGRPVYPY